MRQLFIHIHGQDASWAYRRRDEGLPGEVARGPLSAIPAADDSDEVIVFVPAIDVLLACATLPKQSRSRLQQSVPYALEEQFVDDIESLHVALGTQQKDGRVHAAVVAEKRMQSWLDALQHQGITPAVMMPENLALPQVNGDWSALCLPDGICTVRSGEETGFASERENLAILAQRHRTECSDAKQSDKTIQVRITDCAADDLDAKQLEQDFGLPVRLEACNGDALASLINGYDEHRGINLRQGKYQPASQLLKGGRRWLPTAGLAALWLIIIFANTISDYIDLSMKDAAYREKITQLYKNTFPDAKRVVNARVQMEQQLNALRGSTGSDAGFLSLISKVVEGLAKVEGLDVQRLSYKQGALDLDIKLGDLQQLDKLKQLLVAIQGLEVDVQSATVKNNKLESRIRIGRVK